MPLQEIQNVLRLSYDGLDQEEQDIFLYLACFFQARDIKNSIFHLERHSNVFLLDDCGYSTQAGLTKLCNKALLVDDYYNRVTWSKWKMHDLIRDMGKEIVRGESRDPGNRRHLWDPHDVHQVLENATGTGAIQSLTLDMSITEKELHLNPKAFNGMFNLKLLKVNTYSIIAHERKMFAPKDLESMPDGLRLLCWVGCPLKSLPLSFCTENLVELNLCYSCLERLWDGVQNLVKLKNLFLRGCTQLMEVPDFSKALNLQYADLADCFNLCDLHPSILSLHNLGELDLRGCRKLKSLQIDIYLKSVSTLHPKGGCSSMNEFSVISKRMRVLNLSDTGIKEAHSFGLPLKKLEFLNCKLLKSLPHNFLQVLDLWELRKLTLNFFAPRYSFQWLQSLVLSGTNIESLPASIKHLSMLSYLSLKDCRKLQFLPELPPSNYKLDAGNCISLKEVSISTISCYDPPFEAFCLFKNCWRLNQQTLNTIMSVAHVKMKQAAYIQWLRPHELKECTNNEIIVCLPGSKVPTYKYHYRTTTEATMTIQLSSLSNFLGLIFCVVVSQCQIQLYSPFAKCRCCLQISNGPEAELETTIDFIDLHYWLDIQCDLDHVFLLHDPMFFKSIIASIMQSSADNQCKAYNPKLSLTILPEGQTKIKEWGIYPMYASDLSNFRNQIALGAKTKRHRDTCWLLDIEALPQAK